MAVPKSSLSAGIVIRAVLLEDADVSARTKKVFPIAELAEAVGKALDYITAEYDGMRMRSCYLVDSEEVYENDAFVQRLVFQVKM